MFNIDRNIPPPPKRANRMEVNQDIMKLAPGESILVPVAYRTAAAAYAKRHGIKLITRLEGPDKAHVRLWRAVE